MNFQFLHRLTIFSVLLTVPSFTYAATFNVPSVSYPTIQSGVDAAQNGDTVLVADGTYTGNGNRDIDFHGKSLTVTSQYGPTKTIIDCGGFASTDGSGNHRGFYIHSGEKNATISGFTVKNGYEGYANAYENGSGGGIYTLNYGSVFKITDCIVSANVAHGDGGGIYNENRGLGYNNRSIITLTGCTISNNTAQGNGGGACNVVNGFNAAIIYANCTISGNTAQSGGGGIYNFNTNSHTEPYSASNNTITLSNCAFSKNITRGDGGGVYNCNYVDLYQQAVGGHEKTTLINCILLENMAQHNGSAAYNYNYHGNTTTLINCTTSKNTAQNASGNVYSYNDNGGTIAFANCAFYKDVGTEITNDPSSSPNTDATYSNIQGGYPGTGNIDADPLFVDAPAGDLHLKPGSPCLGAGIATGAPATDLDGNPRPNPPSMGAYEVGVVPAIITGFAITPTQINAPGPTVTATVSVTGNFTKVTVSPAPGSLSSASPTFNLLTNSGGGWGGSFPTAFLKLAKTNPVIFIATGTRADGSTVTVAATLTVGPVVSAPSLALYLSPLAGKVAPDQVVNFQVVVSNITQAPALFTTISVALPDNLDFVASQGFTYDAGKKTLVVTRSLLALPSVAKTFGSNLALLSFSARVRANTHQNSTLVIKSNVTCAGFQSTEQDASLIVGGAILPNSVRVDASQGLGILGGDVSVNGKSNTPLYATLTPKTSLNNWVTLFGDTRPLTLWLEVRHGNGLTPSMSDSLAGFLAQQGLLAPSGSPAYDATFAFIGDTKTITATFGPTAASLTLADMLIEILNLKNKGKGSAPTINQLLGFAEDIKTIVPLGDAVSAFTTPKPMNFGQYGQATAKAAKALVELSVKNSAAKKKLVEVIANRFNILLDPDVFGKVFTLANNVANLTHSFYDLVAFNVMTQGNPMTVSFVATTQ